ncbi:HERC2 [Scenedesmus sp. PABB004]|nr:HERC2 [Scenedesmus sp. PABB004]
MGRQGQGRRPAAAGSSSAAPRRRRPNTDHGQPTNAGRPPETGHSGAQAWRLGAGPQVVPRRGVPHPERVTRARNTTQRTAKGEVWTFGADYNGALGGGDASWLSSPRRVAAPIAAALAADGGAVAVAAGGTFAAARTAAGSVLVWGRLGPATPAAAPFARVALPRGVAVRGMAAGQQHLLMTDGARVWAVGRWLDAAGDEAGAACASAPCELLALPGGAGVARVAAGAHASAAVTDDGGLWLWGRLLDEQHGHGLLRRAGSAAASAGAPAPVDWRWAGFGGATPRRVEELGARVRDVALGGWHALVLTD